MYVETQTTTTREEAEAIAKQLQERYGDWPNNGRTSIEEATLWYPSTGETLAGFKVTVRHYGAE